jgi:hypothetical protein
VLMGERGFRAERARVVAVVTRNRRLCAACEAAGIAVYRNRRSLLRDYPPEDVGTLLGERPADDEARPGPLAPATTVDHRMLVYAVCGRALVIALAALLLPGIAAAALIVAVEVLLIVLLATRLP